MPIGIDPKKLCLHGLSIDQAKTLSQKINKILEDHPTELAWTKISKTILTKQENFNLHLSIFSLLFPNSADHPETAPAWIPDSSDFAKTNLGQFMQELNLTTRKEFHDWSLIHFENFWERMIDKLSIVLHQPFKKICDLNLGIENPRWLVGAKLNICESCFTAPAEKTAIIYQDEIGFSLRRVSFGELNQLTRRISNSLIYMGFMPNDAIAIAMPMTIEAIAIYLGIINMGGVVVSIADSFSADEIATRLQITNAKAIFTQDHILRNGKNLPLYKKVIDANAPTTIVLPISGTVTSLRSGDIEWKQFLIADETSTLHFDDPMKNCNILFSSGTTAEPKAIPWNHTTAIKAASDAYLHQNIQSDDILCWPTNLGWMMGPWLIFAALLNQATIAIYNGSPLTAAFGKFIQDAKVTMQGVVPSIVAHWRQTDCMRLFDWQSIKVFSSTGECSNPEDMLYLMYLAGYKPIIEYCGGTEIGGSYMSSTVIEKNYPSLFTTPAMGLDFILLDEKGQPTDNGEVAIIPPSIGLSVELLNADPHQIYYANMPKSPQGKILRRHGDQARRYENGLYAILGRIDDTMNLGGVKISSAEIERVLAGVDNIIETAAIAVSPLQGPSRLVIYAATQHTLDKDEIKEKMQMRINQYLNPLFKIHDVVFLNELPKTPSNKIMRRTLRKLYRQ